MPYAFAVLFCFDYNVLFDQKTHWVLFFVQWPITALNEVTGINFQPLKYEVEQNICS